MTPDTRSQTRPGTSPSGCSDSPSIHPDHRCLECELADPAVDVTHVPPVREHMGRRVLARLTQLGIPGHASASPPAADTAAAA